MQATSRLGHLFITGPTLLLVMLYGRNLWHQGALLRASSPSSLTLLGYDYVAPAATRVKRRYLPCRERIGRRTLPGSRVLSLTCGRENCARRLVSPFVYLSSHSASLYSSWSILARSSSEKRFKRSFGQTTRLSSSNTVSAPP